MPSPQDLAVLATAAYKRTEKNTTKLPDGWRMVVSPFDRGDGFSYAVFQNETDTVIAYTGTNEQKVADFLYGNIGGAFGFTAPQIFDAMVAYVDARQRFGGNITFTGHSLGGGLASLMAVFFGHEAVTWDPAPFFLTLNGPNLLDYKVRAAALGLSIPEFDKLFNSPISLDPTLIAMREAMVTYRWTKGEVLEGLRKFLPTVGTGIEIESFDIGRQNLDPVQLHSMSLLAAAGLSRPFRDMALNVRDSLTPFFDEGLYTFDPNYSNEENFLDRLLNASIKEKGENALDKYGKDVSKLFGEYGSAQASFKRGLLAVAADYYYKKDTKQLDHIFEEKDQMINFKYSDIGGGEYKSRSRLIEDLKTRLWGYEKKFAYDVVNSNSWHIDLGKGNLNWTSTTGSESDVAIGGSQGDYLDAGAGDDFILGELGYDVLIGGTGSNTLIGGPGFDTYITKSSPQEKDVIVDRDGQITVDGKLATGGVREEGDSYYYSSDKKVRYRLLGADLMINDNVTVKNFTNGLLGIVLVDKRKPEPAKPRKEFQPSFDSNASKINRDPLVLDLDHDGKISAIGSKDSKAYFDFNNDGIAEECGWVAANDGILAFDANGNKSIDDLRELFGTALVSGFEDLRERLDSNSDGVISSLDKDFEKLLVWQDLNGDGVSQSGELRTLTELGIDRINLVSTPANIIVADNIISAVGTFEQNGFTALAADIELSVNFVLTDSNKARSLDQTAPLDPDVFKLPWLRGFGQVQNLNYAYQEDPVLREMARSLVSSPVDILISNFANLFSRWVGLDAAHQLRGVTRSELSVEDKVWILESLTGVDIDKSRIEQNNFNPTIPSKPAGVSGGRTSWVESYVDSQFESFYDNSLRNFVAQVISKDWLKGVSYSMEAGAFLVSDEDLAQMSVQSYIQDISTEFDAELAVLLLSVLKDSGMNLGTDGVLEAVNRSAFREVLVAGFGVDELEVILASGALAKDIDGRTLISVLGGHPSFVVGTPGSDKLFTKNGNDIIFGNDGNDLIDSGDGSDHVYGGEGNDSLFGGGGEDDLYGEDGKDILWGGEGDDCIFGGAGDDTLNGGEGNDELDGGAGNDYVDGGEGQDIYHFSINSGNDTFQSRPDSIVVFGSSIQLANTFFKNDGYDGLEIRFAQSNDVLKINSYFLNNGTQWAFSALQFADGASLSLADVKRLTLSQSQTSGNDTIYGYESNDQILGKEGNDTIWGLAGNDDLDGGAGDDFLIGGTGSDTYHWGLGAGNDTIWEYSRTVPNVTDSDVIIISSGVLPSQVQVRRDKNTYTEDLVLKIEGSSAELRIRDYYHGGVVSGDTIDKIVFSDGTVWDASEIERQQYIGTQRADLINGTDGDDVIDGLAGNDTIYGKKGNDNVIGGDGDDWLYGDEGSDQIKGGSGNDNLDGGSGDDTLDGESGDDSFYGGAGNDKLTGGTGDDWLNGGEGQDVYYYNIGDGIDTIMETGHNSADVDRLVFAPTISPSNVIVKRGINNAILLTFTSGTGQVEIRDFVPNGEPTIEEIVFSDGTVWRTKDVLPKLLLATDGFDDIQGFTTDDLLNGLRGNDQLRGGLGSDTYQFDVDFGEDTIWEESGDDVNQIRFSAGLDSNNAIVSRDYDPADLMIRFIGTSNIVHIKNFFVSENKGEMISTISFANGVTWNFSDIKQQVLYGSVNNPTSFVQGFSSNDVISSDSSQNFLDGKAGSDTYKYGRTSGPDTISESVEDKIGIDTILLDPDVTPSEVKLRVSSQNHLDLELTIGTQSNPLVVKNFFNTNTIENGINSFAIEKIQFEDGTIWGYSDILRLAVTGSRSRDDIIGTDGNDIIDGKGGNDTINGNFGDDTYVIRRGYGSTYIFDFDELNATNTISFADSIADSDVVAYKVDNGFGLIDLVLRLKGSLDKVTLSDYYAADTTFKGVLGNNKIDKVVFSNGVTWDQSLIENAIAKISLDHAPTVSGVMPTSISSAAGTVFSYVIPVNAMTDTDVGDSIFYKVSDGPNSDFLPAGLKFDPSTRTLSGTFSRNTSGVFNLVLTGYDNYNLKATQNFTLNVAAFVNHAPVLNIPIPDQSVLPNTQLSYKVPNGTFSDLDVDETLTYKATLANGSVLPSWLKFDASTLTFSGMSSTTTTVSVKVTAKDLGGLTVSDTFDIVVGIPNLTISGTAGQDNLVGGAGNDTITGAQGNDSLKGGLGNDIYVINRGDGQDTIDSLDILTATDTLRFAVGIIDTDVLAFKSGNDVLFKLKGTTDQITVTNYFAPNTTLDGQAADYKIEKVEFSNGVSWNQTMIQTMVDRAANNKAPSLGTSIANQISKVGMAYSFTVPAATIVDTDVGDSVTYALKMQNGSSLPTWLTFNSATRVISGTPTVSSLGTLSLVLTGTDNYGLSVGQSFTLTVNPANSAPVVSVPLADQTATQSVAFSYTVPSTSFTDPDAGDTLTYVATLADGSALPSWLSFNSSTRTFSGTPINVGTLSIKVTAKDAGNLTVSDIFDVAINVANLSLTGTANADTLTGGGGNDTLSGVAGNDKLIGNSGNDILDGGAGTDTMIGGLGDDTYVVDVATDVVTENLNEGTDTIKSGVTLTLPANLENLILTGTTAINGTGNALSNTITGNSAANTLDGGAGADTLVGGAGNDIYAVDNVGDLIIEKSNEGTDQVNSSVSYTLSANVENLSLLGNANIDAVGNDLANTLIGNAGNNLLDGGAGADSLNGGAGNDTYVVDNVGDVVTEAASAGVDLVKSSISYTLGTNLENLTLTGSAGINATGNTAANVLFGNSGNNILDGGSGADTMAGGIGNDIYIVDNAGDVVTENANEGNDQVKSSISYTLIANLEALLLTGTAAINGTGNALDNLLIGNSANNSLAGGDGNDILQGAAGDDKLTDTAGSNIFDGGAGIDTIIAGAGNEFIAGGIGNDIITTGSGADVIAFNRGDGMDTINASTTKDNTISLGKGIKYADLLFKKSANDLILVTGTSEQITLKDWYAAATNHSVANLQVVIEGTTDYSASSTNKLNNKKIVQFNFDGLANAFDQARTANPNLTSWALSSSLASFYLSGSDTAAIGGDLAYQYAKSGNLSAFSMNPSLSLVSNAQFGSVGQNLQPVANLKDTTVSLI